MPFPWSALGSLALPLFGGLFNRGDQQRKLQAQIQALLSEGGISTRANDIMKYFYQSPAYSQVQGLAMGAGRQAESRAASIGAGMGVTSGMDVIRRGVSAGVGTGTLADLVSRRYDQSRSEALQGNTALANSLVGLGPPPNYSNELFGASLSFLGPLIAQWMKQKYGLGGSTAGPTMGQPGFTYPRG
jgi:hypothetical protein